MSETENFTAKELMEAVDLLFAHFTKELYDQLREDAPEVYDLCQRVHHELWHATTHEERMVRRG